MLLKIYACAIRMPFGFGCHAGAMRASCRCYAGTMHASCMHPDVCYSCTLLLCHLFSLNVKSLAKFQLPPYPVVKDVGEVVVVIVVECIVWFLNKTCLKCVKSQNY